eukprot:gene40506-49372_t
MGVDTDLFLDLSKVPRQFFCAICKDIVCDPVITIYGHLYCREEILAWLARAAHCPVTRKRLIPEQLRKPDAVVMSIYADLEVKCSSKDSGLPEDPAVARNINHGSLAFVACFVMGFVLDVTRPFLPFGLSQSAVVRAIEVTAKVVAMLLLMWGLIYTAIHLPTAGVSGGL